MRRDDDSDDDDDERGKGGGDGAVLDMTLIGDSIYSPYVSMNYLFDSLGYFYSLTTYLIASQELRCPSIRRQLEPVVLFAG